MRGPGALPARPAPEPAGRGAEDGGVDGRAAQRRQRPGPFRRGHVGLLARGRGAQGGAPARSNPCGHRGSLSARQGRGPGRGAPGPQPCGELPVHAARPGAERGRHARPGRVVDPVRRARVQRLDVHRSRRLLDRIGPALGHRRGHRRAQGPAARRGQREGDGASGEDGWAGQRREVDARSAGAQGAHHGLRPSRLQDGRRAGGHFEARTRARRRRRPARSSGRRRPRLSSASWPPKRTCSPTSIGRPAGSTTRSDWKFRFTHLFSSCRVWPAGAPISSNSRNTIG